MFKSTSSKIGLVAALSFTLAAPAFAENTAAEAAADESKPVESGTDREAVEVAENASTDDAPAEDDLSFLSASGGEEGDLDWLEEEFESDYDKGFRNDPDAKPTKPSTTAFFKGPFVWELFSDERLVQTFPSSFDRPVSNANASQLMFQRAGSTPRKLDTVRLNETSLTFTENVANVFVHSEQVDHKIKIAERGSINAVQGNITLVVQEPQFITMNIANEASLRGHNNISCEYTFSVNGKKVEKSTAPRFSSRKPFPRGEYDLSYRYACNGATNNDVGIDKIDFAFYTEGGQKLPVVSLPYVNRNKGYRATKYESPVLDVRVFENQGTNEKAGVLPVNLTKVNLLSKAPQEGGVFEETHATSKFFKGEFIPQKEGVYQFLIRTASNTCATQNYARAKDQLEFRAPRNYGPHYNGQFCTDSTANKIFYLSHPIVVMTKGEDMNVIGATGQSDVVYARPTRDTFGSFDVAADEVGQPIPMTVQMFSNISENGQQTENYSQSQGVLIADVFGEWGGLSWELTNDKRGSKVTKWADHQHQAFQSAAIYVRAPQDKYFRPLAADDFVAEEVQQVAVEEVSLDWLTQENEYDDTPPAKTVKLSGANFSPSEEFQTDDDQNLAVNPTMSLFNLSSR